MKTSHIYCTWLNVVSHAGVGGGGGLSQRRGCLKAWTLGYRGMDHYLCFMFVCYVLLSFLIVFQLSTLWFSDSLSLVADCRKLEFNDIQCAYVFVSFTVFLKS